jgi:hypothetical protein
MSLASSSSVFGVSLANLIAGTVGGLVRTMVRGTTSWRRRTTTAIVGGFVSGFGTPVVGPIAAGMLATYGAIPPEATYGLVGFLLGVTGQTLCEGAIARASKLTRDAG